MGICLGLGLPKLKIYLEIYPGDPLGTLARDITRILPGDEARDPPWTGAIDLLGARASGTGDLPGGLLSKDKDEARGLSGSEFYL